MSNHPPTEAPTWLREHLPQPLASLVAWLTSPWVITLISLLSIGLFVLSLLGVPWLVRRLPQDYLIQHARRPEAHGVTLLGRIARNAFGSVLLLLGILMLVLPGQGVLTIMVALTLLDFPGKTALKRRLVESPRVFSAINRIRRRTGHPELLSPTEHSSAALRKSVDRR